jgi:hypothetical protein
MNEKMYKHRKIRVTVAGISELLLRDQWVLLLLLLLGSQA